MVKQSFVAIGTKIGSGFAIVVAAILFLGMLLHRHPGPASHTDGHMQIPAKVLDSHAVPAKVLPAQSTAAVDD